MKAAARACLFTLVVQLVPPSRLPTVHAAQRALDTNVAAGALALLESPADLLPRIQLALHDPDPTVRSVAARISGIRGLSGAADDLTRVLGVESDPLAEVEEARALVFLRGSTAVEAILRRPYRGNAQVVVNIAEWVAATQPESLAGGLATLAQRLGERRGLLDRAVLTVVSKRPDLAASTLRKWFSVHPLTPGSALIEGIDPTDGFVAPFLAESLRTGETDLRQTITWMLVNRVVRGSVLPPEIVAALEELDQRDPPNVPLSWDTFGRQVLARYRGAAIVDCSAWLSSQADLHDRDAMELVGATRISKDERAALHAVLGDRFPLREVPPVRSPAPDVEPGSRLRTLPVFWTGFVSGLMNAGGCQPSGEPMFGALRAFYGEDGRTTRVNTDSSQLTPSCAKVLAALARLVLADPLDLPARAAGEVILVAMDAQNVQCASEAPDPELDGPIAGSNPALITQPEKIRKTAPQYPPELARRRVGGVVMADVHFSASGCPRSVRVTRGIHPALDMAAVAAISGWRFSPVRLNDVPRPFKMSASIRFTP